MNIETQPRAQTQPAPRTPARASWGARLVGGVSVAALLFLTLPIVALLWRAVTEQGWASLGDAVVVDAILLSFASTAVALLLTITFGLPLAYVFARWRFPLRRFLNVLIELPIVLPPAVAGLGLLLLFGRRGLLGPALGEIGVSLPFTFWAVVLAQTFVSAPFFIRSAQVGLSGVPREVEDAARVDGADGWVLFRTITLPLARRALASGAILSWARALGEFGATILFAGSLQGRTQTMPLLIYNILERDINAAIWTGLLLVALALTALLVSGLLARGEVGD